jgi:tetratricopeptide (TPR) repeat protein
MSTSQLTEELKKYPPGSVKYYIIRGELHLRNHSYQEAVNDYSAAIKLEPSNLSSYANRGLAYANIEDDEKAIYDFTVYIDNHYKAPGPTTVDLLNAHHLRATLYYKQKKFIESYEDINTLLGIDPNYFAAYIIRTHIYLNYFNSPDDALRDIDTFLSIVPNYIRADVIAKLYESRADAYGMKGERDKSIENLGIAISLDPNRGAFYFKRGIDYKAQKRYAEAINDFDTAARIRPKDATAYSVRGSTYLTMAQEETDPSKKAEYQRRAEEDSAMYTRLTGKTVDWKK